MIVASYHVQDLPHRIKPLPWQRLGLPFTRTGYGRRLPSTVQVQLPSSKRWRRVYVYCFSNAGTAYVEASTKSERADGRLRPDWIVIGGSVGGPNYQGEV